MDKEPIKEKYIIYLQNALFIIIDEYLDHPGEIGEALSEAIDRTLKDIYPARTNDYLSAMEDIRRDWLFVFCGGFKKGFEKLMNKKKDLIL